MIVDKARDVCFIGWPGFLLSVAIILFSLVACVVGATSVLVTGEWYSLEVLWVWGYKCVTC